MNTDNQYGSIPSGGICPCGGRLVYSVWETIKEFKERVTCKACGRCESASKSIESMGN